MNKFGKPVWTPTQDAFLSARWLEGISAASIAREMDSNGWPGRNAVSGRVHRLGLKRQVVEISLDPPPKKKRRRSRAKAKRVTPFRKPQISERPQPANLYVPFGVPCPLVDLHDCSCRWPIGDRIPFLFCNAVRKEPHPYCADHCREAYKPMREIDIAA